MKDAKKLQKARNLIEEFKKIYAKEIGYSIIILSRYDNQDILNSLSIHELRQIADRHVPYGKTILSKTRKKEVILYKHIFCKIAREMGFTFKYIGDFLNVDHSTIIHSVNKINDLLDVESKEHVRAYALYMEDVKIEIEKKQSKDGRTIQHINTEEANPESVLHDVLSKEQY